MRNRSGRSYVPRLGLLVAPIALLLACAGGGPSLSPTATPAPTTTAGSTTTAGPTPPTATPSPEASHIDHPGGATDVVLRMQAGGGLVPPGYFATEAPIFTLYGDGTAIYRPAADPSGNGLPPFLKATLSADQMDALLSAALTEGHLASARAFYTVGGVYDAGTTTFTIQAGGVTKVVAVYALGITTGLLDRDAADYQAFLELSSRLGNFATEIAAGHATSAGTYEPPRYRAVLLRQEGAGTPKAWPWPDLTLDDFVLDPDRGSWRVAAITADQAARLATIPSGGVQGVLIASPDGTQQFSLSLRPLLPGDTVVPATSHVVGSGRGPVHA